MTRRSLVFLIALPVLAAACSDSGHSIAMQEVAALQPAGAVSAGVAWRF